MSSSSGGFTDWIVVPAKERLCCIGRKRDNDSDDCTAEEPGHVTVNGRSRMTELRMTAVSPMPATEEELNTKFADLVSELGLEGPQRDAMYRLSPEKKWQIYCSKKKEQTLPSSTLLSPENYISSLSAFGEVSSPDKSVLDNRTLIVESLRTALRSQPIKFVVKFLDLGGLDALLRFLESMDPASRQQQIHTTIISCIQNIMNGPEGRSHVISHPSAIQVIALSLSTSNVRTKIAVLDLLGATCLVPGGHRKVLQAMTNFQEVMMERARFQSLLVDLDTTHDDFRWNVAIKTAIMSFVNAVINCGPGKTHLEFRLHLRYEFLMLGIQSIVEKLREIGNETLTRHVEFFELVRNTDEKELGKRFSESHIDTKSASSMFELLRKKLSFASAYPHFLSIFFHLLQLPTTGTRVTQYWQLIDRIIQQVSLQTKSNQDDDVTPLEIDVKKLVSQLTNETAIKDTLQKMREIEKAKDEVSSKLAKKERECETKTQEKDDLMQALSNLRTRTEKDISAYQDKINHLTCKITELQETMELHKMNPGLVSQLSHDSATIPSSPHLSPIDSTPVSPIEENGFTSPAPPPPPPPSGVPPPPPPPPGGLFGAPVKVKNCPQPTQPLKSFNWTKLPDNKLHGTIWMEIDDAKAFKTLDLEDLERNFSAYQRQDDGDGSSRSPAKARELSVIDGRRAQNCTIMLSKLKMTNEELTKAILSADSQDDIPRDMCEQLLKFVPTTEEVQMLSEHAREHNQMARADQFLFQMSRIDHYEERLKALHFKKNYSERMSTAIPRVKDVAEASNEVMNSRCFRGILEIVLAFGNYMNRGQRGNASGFRISSLNKIIDTKSSTNKRSTLLHYLVDLIDTKYRNLLGLEEELGHIKGASKIKLTDLESEISTLRLGLREIEKELEYQRRKVQNGIRTESDSFVSVVSPFLELANCRFSDLEYDFREMKEQFFKCVELLGEEAKTTQPDDFFGTFDQFLVSLSESRQENAIWRKIKEEEERRASKEAEMKAERERRKLCSEPNLNADDQNGEMEELIFALKNLNAFGFESNPAKKKTRSRLASHGQVLSSESLSATPKYRRQSTNTGTDRIFMIS